MKRVNQIFRHPLYQDALRTIEEAEQERIFCRHDMEHFLSVARLAYIYNQREEVGVSKPVIYGAALLHDIGRSQEYKSGLPHHEAGMSLAESILAACGFSDEEQSQILDAILFHRKEGKQGGKDLRSLLYRADKASRNCFMCRERDQCKWPKEQMNLEIKD